VKRRIFSYKPCVQMPTSRMSSRDFKFERNMERATSVETNLINKQRQSASFAAPLRNRHFTVEMRIWQLHLNLFVRETPNFYKPLKKTPTTRPTRPRIIALTPAATESGQPSMTTEAYKAGAIPLAKGEGSGRNPGTERIKTPTVHARFPSRSRPAGRRRRQNG
jgi:hypothetical protein